MAICTIFGAHRGRGVQNFLNNILKMNIMISAVDIFLDERKKFCRKDVQILSVYLD